MALAIKKLDRGQGLRIRKSDGRPLHKIRIDLGWQSKKYDTQKNFDVDVTVCALKDVPGKAFPQLLSEDWFIYYYQKRSPFDAIIHSGDDREGGDGVRESVDIDLDKIPQECSVIAVILTIDEGLEKGQNFGSIDRSFARLVDADGDEVLATIDLENEEKTAAATAVLFAEVKRTADGWTYKNVTEGFVQGLGDFLVAFGGAVDDAAAPRN